jgi:hypothetical protein
VNKTIIHVPEGAKEAIREKDVPPAFQRKGQRVLQADVSIVSCSSTIIIVIIITSSPTQFL